MDLPWQGPQGCVGGGGFGGWREIGCDDLQAKGFVGKVVGSVSGEGMDGTTVGRGCGSKELREGGHVQCLSTRLLIITDCAEC